MNKKMNIIHTIKKLFKMEYKSDFHTFIDKLRNLKHPRIHKYKYRENAVRLPFKIKHYLRPLWDESDAGSGTTLSSVSEDDYDEEESEYEESAYSTTTDESEDLTEESVVMRRIQTYKYKEHGVKLPRRFNSDKRY